MSRVYWHADVTAAGTSACRGGGRVAPVVRPEVLRTSRRRHRQEDLDPRTERTSTLEVSGLHGSGGGGDEGAVAQVHRQLPGMGLALGAVRLRQHGLPHAGQDEHLAVAVGEPHLDVRGLGTSGGGHEEIAGDAGVRPVALPVLGDHRGRPAPGPHVEGHPLESGPLLLRDTEEDTLIRADLGAGGGVPRHGSRVPVPDRAHHPVDEGAEQQEQQENTDRPPDVLPPDPHGHLPCVPPRAPSAR